MTQTILLISASNEIRVRVGAFSIALSLNHKL